MRVGPSLVPRAGRVSFLGGPVRVGPSLVPRPTRAGDKRGRRPSTFDLLSHALACTLMREHSIGLHAL